VSDISQRAAQARLNQQGSLTFRHSLKKERMFSDEMHIYYHIFLFYNDTLRSFFKENINQLL